MIQLLLNGLLAGSIYSLVGLGFGVAYRANGVLSIAHAMAITGGCYLTYLLAQQMDLPLSQAILLAVCCVALVGWCIQKAVFQVMSQRGSSGTAQLLASLGLYIVLHNLVAMCFGDETLTMRGNHVSIGVSMLGGYLTRLQLVIVLANLLVGLALWLFTSRTRLGLHIRAVADSQDLAQISGVRIERTILWAAVISSVLGAVTGILIGHDTDITPWIGFHFLFPGIVAVIAGGKGNLLGCISCGMCLGILQNLAVWKIPSQWQETIIFAALIGVLAFLPHGIFAMPQNRKAV